MADLIPMLMAAAGNSSGPPTSIYSEDVFTDTSGAISFVVPAGVTSISAVCIGGGGGGLGSTNGGTGGGGGDLRYRNNITVVPGQTLTITVGAAGNPGAQGGFSRIALGGTTLLEAAGGCAGIASGGTAGSKNGTSSTIGGSIGGGDGGIPIAGDVTGSPGAGGVGGYSGNGGNGGVDGVNAGAGGNGAGGAGGGGGEGTTSFTVFGGVGGGVSVFGEGDSGVGGILAGDGQCATGGSYGDGSPSGALGATVGATNPYFYPVYFGAGGAGRDRSGATSGSQGAVRIVWPGTTRSFPSTNVWMSEIFPTVIETQSDTNTPTIPASAQAGDLAVLFYCLVQNIVQTDPTGWTRIAIVNDSVTSAGLWYRILQAGDAGTTVTMTSGASPSAEMILFRKATGTVSSVSVKEPLMQRVLGSAGYSTVKTVSTGTGPLILIASRYFSQYTYTTSQLYFVGGHAGLTKVEPSAVFPNANGDPTRQGFMRFRIYDQPPPANVTVSTFASIQTGCVGSCFLEVT